MKIKPFLALLGTLILFSTYEIASKMITYKIPPLQINFLRFLAGGLLLLPIALYLNRRDNIKVTGQDVIELGKLGIVMVTLSLSMLQEAILFIPASAAAVLFCTNPLFAHLYEAFINREFIDRRKRLGLLISMTGLLIIVAGKFTQHQAGHKALLGMGLTLASAILFGIYIVMAKGATDRVGSLTANAVSFLIGSIACIPLLLWFKIPLFRFDLSVWPQMLYLSVGITCGAYILFLYALRHMSAAAGSLIFFAKPVVAAALASLILGDRITLPFALGTVGIVAGLFFVTRK